MQSNHIIWTMWWQGEENAPQIVKACLNSMRRNSGSAKVIVLNESNYTNYLSLPEHIMEKQKKGAFSLTHFSDIIRVNILSKHGGLWLDSTIYVNEPIPSEIFEQEFFTLKIPGTYKGISNNQWCGFCIGAQSHNIIFAKQVKLLNAYWEKESLMIDYLLIDYFFYMIFHKIEKATELLKQVVLYEGEIYSMQDNLFNKAYELKDFPIFNKLNWKIDYQIDNNLYQKILTTEYCEPSQSVSDNKGKLSKIKNRYLSLLRHFKTLFNYNRLIQYGITIQIYAFLMAIFRTSNSAFITKMSQKYHQKILKYLEQYWK